MNAAGATPDRMQALVVDTSGKRHPQLHIKLKEMGFAQVAVYDSLDDAKTSSLYFPDPSLIVVFLPEAAGERLNYARHFQRGATKPVEVIVVAGINASESLRREFLNLKVADFVRVEDPLETLATVKAVLDDPEKFAPPPDPTASALRFRAQFQRSDGSSDATPTFEGFAADGAQSAGSQSIQSVAEVGPPDEEDERWATSTGPAPRRAPMLRFRIKPERKAAARAERARSHKLIARALIALTGVLLGALALFIFSGQFSKSDSGGENHQPGDAASETPAAVASPTPAPALTPEIASPLLPTPAPTPEAIAETPKPAPDPDAEAAPFAGATPRPFGWNEGGS